MPQTPIIDFLKRSKKNKGKLLTMVEEWLVENSNEINKYTTEDYDLLQHLILEGAKRDPSVFSPSGATACRRAQVINKSFNLTRQETDPKLMRIFDDGFWRHIRWQILFNKMGILQSAETFVKLGTYDYGGSTDVVLNIPYEDGDRLTILDIKGANASRWNEINRSNKPMFPHYVQVQIYMYINKIDHGILWYENKNTNEVCEIILTKDKEFQKSAKRRQRYMHRYIDYNAFPKEECSVGDDKDRQYVDCRFKSVCQRLPVHLIESGKVLKIGEPRNPTKDPNFLRHNKLPLVKLRGSKPSLRKVGSLGYLVPKAPSEDMDDLVEKYSMPLELSNIQPFQHLRDLMGFYTTEASRAIVDIAKYKGHRRYLQARLKQRRAFILGSAGNIKWRAEAEVAGDRRAIDIGGELDNCESIIELLEALHVGYVRNYDALSRELTARSGDRDRWYGRGGSGR